MGMFTTVIHPITGREIQIYGGDDWCEVYRVGDTVDWHLGPRVGRYHLLDGVYGENGYSTNAEAYVIIQNHKIVAVVDGVPVEKYENGFRKYPGVSTSDEDLITEYKLTQAWGFKPIYLYDESLYSKKEWEIYVKQKQEFEKEEEEFRKSIEHLSEREQFAQILVRPLRTNIMYQELGKKLLMMEEVN